MVRQEGGRGEGAGGAGNLHVINTCHGQDVPSQPHPLAAAQGLQGHSNDYKGAKHLAASLQEECPTAKGVSSPEGDVGRQLQARSARKLQFVARGTGYKCLFNKVHVYTGVPVPTNQQQLRARCLQGVMLTTGTCILQGIHFRRGAA